MATPMGGLRKAAAVETCESDSDDCHMYTPKPKPSTSAILKSHPAENISFSLCIRLFW